MNEKLAELATQAGLGVIRNKGWHPLPIGSKHIEHFAQLVRQDEREACAKLCVEWGDFAGIELAMQIRQRDKNETDK